ncbi:hypothetical protein GCM10011378_16170 [Hymenobacter glacieicola]|uniref:Uncharacterized protein n=1 Tax=Hymenobacter glacieicola TaxID=1562124 RepID=A0ABQ1WTA8_9BACT|nr:hypothetical protein GCM10011378_16170 [Hymenobacter glacieicola]
MIGNENEQLVARLIGIHPGPQIQRGMLDEPAGKYGSAPAQQGHLRVPKPVLLLRAPGFGRYL